MVCGLTLSLGVLCWAGVTRNGIHGRFLIPPPSPPPLPSDSAGVPNASHHGRGLIV